MLIDNKCVRTVLTRATHNAPPPLPPQITVHGGFLAAYNSVKPQVRSSKAHAASLLLAFAMPAATQAPCTTAAR